MEFDPIGLAGGINGYNYVGGNPLRWVDPLGLATTVITSGWNGGANIFGHVALAFTGQGVYSYGTTELYGSSTTGYLNGQLSNRNVTITTLNTTPEQEQAMINYYNSNHGKGSKYSAQSNNCANAAAGALSNAGVIGTPLITDLTIPYDVQRWTSNQPGAVTQTLTQGSLAPSNFRSFNP